MKKIILVGLTSIFVLSLINGCKKNSSKQTKEEVVADLSKKFVTDDKFADFFKHVIKDARKVYKIQSPAIPHIEDVNSDSTEVYDYVTGIVTSEVFLKEAYPEFFELDLSNQQTIINNVMNTVKVLNFRIANPQNKLVVYGDEAINDFNLDPPATYSADGGLTWGEFALCTAGALGAALGEYGGILKEVWGLLSGGPAAIGWSQTFSIINKVVKNAVPWYKAFSVAVGYATCLIAAW